MSVSVKTSAGLALASLVALTLGASCGSSGSKCTKIGCHDQFVIGFTHERWDEGAYTIDLSVDGYDVECSFDFPFPTVSPEVCPDGAGVVFWAYREEEDQPFEPRGIIVLGEPHEVSISMSIDGEPLVSESFEVGDRRTYPNGPACDEGCLDEQAELDFDGSGEGGAGGDAG